MLNCLNMLSSGNRADNNDDVVYMAEETGRQYFLKFCEDIVNIYAEAVLKRWPTAEELDDVETKYERKGFRGCVGAINCSKIFWTNCSAQDKGQ